jgi:DNA polymerase III, gamma/tau subunits
MLILQGINILIFSDFRFVLSCNDSTKIIDAIQSRCAILRFTKLTDKQVLTRLMEIIDNEKVK